MPKFSLLNSLDYTAKESLQAISENLQKIKESRATLLLSTVPQKSVVASSTLQKMAPLLDQPAGLPKI